jgi:hypothetical protein
MYAFQMEQHTVVVPQSPHFYASTVQDAELEERAETIINPEQQLLELQV